MFLSLLKPDIVWFTFLAPCPGEKIVGSQKRWSRCAVCCSTILLPLKKQNEHQLWSNVLWENFFKTLVSDMLIVIRLLMTVKEITKKYKTKTETKLVLLTRIKIMVFCCGISILSLLQKCIIPYHSFLDCWITMFKFLFSVWNLKRQYLPVKDFEIPWFQTRKDSWVPWGIGISTSSPRVLHSAWGVSGSVGGASH